ncbi:hypothetical protein BST61_g6198 [Cercospora zeina]
MGMVGRGSDSTSIGSAAERDDRALAGLAAEPQSGPGAKHTAAAIILITGNRIGKARREQVNSCKASKFSLSPWRKNWYRRISGQYSPRIRAKFQWNTSVDLL